MSSVELSEDAPAPRLCHLIKWDDFDGYGFNLHAEKSKAGQYIGKVDEGSPAEYADLREGDCIVEVNGVNIANENHKQVVERIKAVPNETRLLVIDEEGKKWYKDRKLVVKGTQHNVIYNKTPVPRPRHKDLNGNRETLNGHLDHVTQSDSSNKENEEHNHKVEEKRIEPPPKELEDEVNRTESSENSEKVEDRSKEEVESSRSSTPQSLSKSENLASGGSTGSVPDSPQSFKGSNHQLNGSKVTNSNGAVDLNLNMSASEMRQLLASRKKHDPKKIQMDLRKKYDIIQQM
ncbi:Na(+)/H(+) exchange regulatory cofactor NHE-RF1-like [Centruroides sculpturatus]|uniref:Na(+)/H(+) exchange regulatory cofactor NHE-RF1-like n=1 Tax=Centruroides sculpturatus TaxID=218467 RepID=UPI000C6E73FC|nr:Na(+)/H(+) exchange regulatory cofactor NHE-RF1-like [Centruroides sculpturatus]